MAVTVCIARQFGSGGHEVGLALSNKLGIPFYDKELLATAAERSGILRELFEKHDEQPIKPVNFVPVSTPKAGSFAEYLGYAPADRMQKALSETIREAAEEGPCVIIGRCADYILRGQPGLVSVFVHAPVEHRIKRVQRMHNLDEDAARALVRKTDRARANYYSFYTDRNWGDADNYDLVVNTGRLGVEGAASLLRDACAHFVLKK